MGQRTLLVQSTALRVKSKGRRRRRLSVLLATAAAIFCSLVTPSHSSDTPVLSRNLFGSPGMVEMPDARMAPDGELSVGASFFKNTQHYDLGFQVLPWLETSFRYSGLSHYDPLYPVYYDRSFAFKARLWEEGTNFPALAVGVNDMIGTGIYGGEYIVASKQFGSVDVSLGMGWGRLGTANTVKNPLSLISSSFLRDRGASTPGSTNFGGLFHGPEVGFFGGLNWQTPIDGLAVSAEYSSDAYQVEASRGNFNPRTQFNIGASYQAFDAVGLSLSWLHGESIAGAVTFLLNPKTDPFPNRLGPAPTVPRIRTSAEQQAALDNMAGRPTFAMQSAHTSQIALVDSLWNSSIALEDMTLSGRTLSIRVSGGDLEVACHAAAQAVAGANLGVSTVIATHAKQSARCPVANGVVLINATQTTSDPQPFRGLVLASARTTMIDAATPAPTSNAAAIAAIRKDAAAQSISVLAVSLRGSDAIVYFGNYHYFYEHDAVDRLVRILMSNAPPQIERFQLIATVNGVPHRKFEILRGPTERSFDQTGDFSIAAQDHPSEPAPMQNPIFWSQTKQTYPRFEWSVFPQFRQQLFDPINPFAVQFLGGVAASVDLLPGLSVEGEAEASLYDNFNTLRGSDSVLPHVRSDFIRYFTKGKNGIGNLEVDYQFRLAPTVLAIARAGYLESMFAGVGGEILWRPEGQRWALGVDLYDVKQRSFDRLFGLQNYHTVTGHVSLYYASPWYGLNFAVRTGQYLAGDRGITFETTRRFESGVEIGAFFSRTNVSATNFGEGSFDKGIIIRIPLGLMAPIDTQSQFNMDLRPVQRDGGQRLLGDTILYEETRRTSSVEMRTDDGAENTQLIGD